MRNCESVGHQNCSHPPLQLRAVRLRPGPGRPVRSFVRSAVYHTINAQFSAYELQEPSSTFYSAQTKQSLVLRLDRLSSYVRTELRRQGFEGDRVSVERMLNMRFEGTDTALMVLPDGNDGDGQEDFEAAFKRVYKTEFGFLLETKSIIVDDIKVGLFTCV